MNNECYIPEGTFGNAKGEIIDVAVWYKEVELRKYSRRNMELILEVVLGEDGVRIDIEYFFDSLTWQSPFTRIDEISENM